MSRFGYCAYGLWSAFRWFFTETMLMIRLPSAVAFRCASRSSVIEANRVRRRYS